MSLVSDVSLLVDEAATPTWWTSAQVYAAINEALLEDWAVMRPASTTSTLSLSTGTDLYAFDATTIMIPQYFVDPDENVLMFPTVHDELENWSRRWKEEAAAKPKWTVLWDASHFRFFPSPDGPYTRVLWGVGWPPEIGTATLDTTLENFQRKAVILRAAASLLDLTQPQLADAYRVEANAHAKRAIAQVRQSFNGNVDRLRPGTGWSVAQFGRINQGRKYR